MVFLPTRRCIYRERYANGKKEDFTAGASLGAARDLQFKHVATGFEFSFPQRNGDVFGSSSLSAAAVGGGCVR